MTTEKSYISWLVVAIIIAISIIYFHVTTTLLHSNSENMAFIEKELVGLADYRKILPRYFAIKHNSNNQALNNEAKIIREEIRTIGDKSNLILDPSLESYYLVNILFNHVPKLIDNTPYSFEDLNHTAQVLGENAEPIKTAIQKLEHKPSDIENYPTQVQEISNSAIYLLNQLLQNRLAKYKQERGVSLSIITGLYFTLTFLVIFAIRNYVSRQEINSAYEKQILINKLAVKNNELEQFTYATAHDLREPVRTICCFTSLLKKEVGEELGISASEYAEVIERTSRRAEQMLGDLLNYAKLTEEQIILKNCDCREEIAAVLEDLKSAITNIKPNIIISEMPENPFIIQTVPSLLRRVFLNLLDNAIKYRKKEETLEIYISVEQKKDSWLFSIKDNGIGIDAAHIIAVFEPFKRLYPEYNDGNGIGLTSCKKIVEMLGGKIWLTAERGIGTIVYFEIPR
jgi:signal transduction histidine kinase